MCGVHLLQLRCACGCMSCHGAATMLLIVPPLGGCVLCHSAAAHVATAAALLIVLPSGSCVSCLVFKSPVRSGLLPFLGATGTATGCMQTDSRRNRTGTTPDWLQLQPRHKKTSRNWLRPVFLQLVATG